MYFRLSKYFKMIKNKQNKQNVNYFIRVIKYLVLPIFIKYVKND